MSTAKSKEAVAEKLVSSLTSFTEACAEVWPGDSPLQNAVSSLKELDLEAKVSLTEHIVKAFDKTWEDLALAKDAAFWDHESFAVFHAKQKFTNANDDIREAVWDHVKNITNSVVVARMYTAIPGSLLTMVDGLTSKLTGQMASGELDPKSINPLALGQQVLSQLSQKDMEDMSQNLMNTFGNDPSSIMRMLSSIQSIVPPEVSNSLGDMSALGNIANFANMANVFGNLQAKPGGGKKQ